MRFNLGGELPSHPIEAKTKLNLPEGWVPVGIVGERELYEPTPMNKTKAEQYDEQYGEKNWAVMRHATEDNEHTQLLDVIVNAKEAEAQNIEVQDLSSEEFQIPVSHDEEQ